jgi:hypothetical protein
MDAPTYMLFIIGGVLVSRFMMQNSGRKGAR